jgi:hypothetical protein
VELFHAVANIDDQQGHPVVVYAIQEDTLQITPVHSVKDHMFELASEEFRRQYAEYESRRFNNNDRNRKQRAQHLIYRGYQFEGNNNVLVITKNADIHVTENRMISHQTSILLIRFLSLPDFFAVAQDLNANINWNISGTCRISPEGNMIHLGCRKGSGRHKYYYYCRTRQNLREINRYHSRMNVLAKQIMRQHFPGAYREIRRWMRYTNTKIPFELGGSDGFCCEMIVSHNLGNEAHVDQDIANKCVSIWTVGVGTPENPQGSYFVLPYLTCVVGNKQYRGIVVKLRQGCAIEWNGRYVFHASTSPSDPNAVVNGNFFGVTKV